MPGWPGIGCSGANRKESMHIAAANTAAIVTPIDPILYDAGIPIIQNSYLLYPGAFFFAGNELNLLSEILILKS